jgi:hypothetical protein
VRTALFIAVALLSLFCGAAAAATPLCLEVRADADSAGLRKLVEDELLHHPSHHLVAAGCASQLTVELFTAAGTRYLTARINQEVPVRFAVKGAREIDEKLTEALRQVLRNDPVYLAEDLSRLNAVWRSGANLVRHGSNRYRLELFELVGGGGANPVFASGGAFTVARGIDHVQVFARLEVAGSPSSRRDGAVTLRVLAGGDLGFLWEASARGNATVYLGPGVGLHYLRFEGWQNGAEVTPANALLFSVAARAGARFLRFYGFDIDLYVQAHFPFYKTHDPDSTLIDAYTPYAMLGLGVGF